MSGALLLSLLLWTLTIPIVVLALVPYRRRP